MLLFTLPARLVFRGRLMGGRSEVLVASSSTAPTRHQEPIAGLDEIVQHFAGFGIVDDGSNRNRKFNRFALPPAPVAALAMPASLGGVFRIKPEVKQSVVVLAGNQSDIAAASAVATARASSGYVLLPPEGQTTVSTIAGFYADFDFIDKHAGSGLWGVG